MVRVGYKVGYKRISLRKQKKWHSHLFIRWFPSTTTSHVSLGTAPILPRHSHSPIRWQCAAIRSPAFLRSISMSFHPSFLPIHPTNHAIALQSVAVSSSRTFRHSHEMMSSAAGRVIHRGVRSFRLGVWSWLIDYWWLYRKRSGFLEMIFRVHNR